MYPAEWSGLKKLLMLKAASGGSAPQTETVSGSLVTFETTKARPLKECRVDFLPKQEGSGDPSPTNIRPISGWDGLSVFVSPTTTGGTEYPVTWQSAGTVYGGYVDLVRGELVATHGMSVLDGSEQNWKWSASNNGIAFISIDQLKSGRWFSDESSLCDKALKVNSSTNGSLQCLIGGGNKSIYFYNSTTSIQGITDLESFKTWLTTNNITVTYPLDTPVTYPLTPQQITTLIGTNNIWSDAGNVTVTYTK